MTFSEFLLIYVTNVFETLTVPEIIRPKLEEVTRKNIKLYFGVFTLFLINYTKL